MLKKFSWKKMLLTLVMVLGFSDITFAANNNFTNKKEFGYLGAKIGILDAPDYMESGGYEDDQVTTYGAEAFYLKNINENGVALGINGNYTVFSFKGSLPDGSEATADFKFKGIGALLGKVETAKNSKMAYFIGYEYYFINFDFSIDNPDYQGFNYSDSGNGNGVVVGAYMADKSNLGIGIGFRYILMEGDSENKMYEIFFSAGYAF